MNLAVINTRPRVRQRVSRVKTVRAVAADLGEIKTNRRVVRRVRVYNMVFRNNHIYDRNRCFREDSKSGEKIRR